MSLNMIKIRCMHSFWSNKQHSQLNQPQKLNKIQDQVRVLYLLFDWPWGWFGVVWHLVVVASGGRRWWQWVAVVSQQSGRKWPTCIAARNRARAVLAFVGPLVGFWSLPLVGEVLGVFRGGSWWQWLDRKWSENPTEIFAQQGCGVIGREGLRAFFRPLLLRLSQGVSWFL